MNEASFWRWLRKRLPPGEFDRIESPISPGFPDVHFIITSRRRGVIELKATRQKSGYPFKADRCGMRPAQILWWSRYVRRGGLGYIGAAIGSDVAFWPGTIATTINDLSVDQMRELALFWRPRRGLKRVPIDEFDLYV